MNLERLTPDMIWQMCKGDPHLSTDERDEVKASVYDPTLFQRLLYGAAGAGVAKVLLSFFNLSNKARILMTMAGFGVGQFVLNAIQQDKSRGIKYNKQTDMYELQS